MLFPSLLISQVLLNQIDDFEDFTTRNWTKNNSIPNANIPDDGPLGSGDNFLRIISTGSGTGLNLLTLNNAQWLGDYYQNNGSNRIKYISMDVRNSGSNIIFLRMSFKHNNSPLEIWSTINPVAIIPGEGWKKINFHIEQASVVRVSGLNPYTTTFNNVHEVRLLHNDAPSWESDPIEATLDIDNIMARNSPLLGINEVSFTTMKLHPNPANAYVKIDNSNGATENFTFKIADMTGRIIAKGNSKYSEKIDIDNLSKGNYVIMIQDESGQISTGKIIKN